MTQKYPQNLSLREIRFLLVEKRRAQRHVRIENFSRTGRVIPFANEQNTPILIEQRFPNRNAHHHGVKYTKHSWVDILLLCVESLAIAAVIFIILNGFYTLGKLNQSVAATFQQPALEPTSLIQEVVLPEGHTPPNSPGGTRPNEAEIPEHLRPVWLSITNLPTPMPVIRQAIRIQIPAIDVDAPVVQGDGWEQLKKGVAQHVGTPNPGEGGNIVLSGHNDVYGEVFRDLDRLQPGDSVILFTGQRQYIYIITGTQIVEPTAVEVMAPSQDERVTLISCHPYLVDTHRIVISAILQSR